MRSSSARLTGRANAVNAHPGCPTVIETHRPVKLSDNVHFWLAEIHPRVWQLTGFIQAENGQGGEVKVNVGGWSQNLKLGEQPVLVSGTFYGEKKPETIDILDDDAISLRSVDPELSASGRMTFAEVASLTLGSVAILSSVGLALAVWFRGRKTKSRLERLNQKIEENRPVPAAPSGFGFVERPVSKLSDAVVDQLQNLFDLRYAAATEFATRINEHNSALQKLRNGLGDPERLRPDSIVQAPAVVKPAFSAQERFCAAVNVWLANVGSPRQSVLRHLEAVELPGSCLAFLEGIEEAKADVTVPLTLSSRNDGWWVVTRIEGQDCFACPLDSSFLAGLSSAGEPLVRGIVIREQSLCLSAEPGGRCGG